MLVELTWLALQVSSLCMDQTLQWHHNEFDGHLNRWRIDCLLNRFSGADQSSASLAFVRGIPRRPVNSSHKGLVIQKIFQFDDVIMNSVIRHYSKWPSTFREISRPFECNEWEEYLPLLSRHPHYYPFLWQQTPDNQLAPRCPLFRAASALFHSGFGTKKAWINSNSLALGKRGNDFNSVIFRCMQWIFKLI